MKTASKQFMQKNGIVFLLVLATGILAAPQLAFALIPDAQNDEFSTPEDTTFTLIAPGILDNDSDSDGDDITAVHDSGPTNGELVFNSDGSFEYTPNADFVGEDSFSYHANDGTDDGNIATVAIQVNPKVTDSIIDSILEQIQMLFDKIFSIESDVAELKEQNAALESRVASLEAKITSGSSHDDDDDHNHDKKSGKNEIKALKKEYNMQKKMLKDEFKEKERELKNQFKDSKHDKHDDHDDDDDD